VVLVVVVEAAVASAAAGDTARPRA
jgi:hypothetical protein